MSGNLTAEILVVDDNVESLRMIESVLIEAGYRVRTAPDGLLTLRSIRFRPPSLVLLDVRMPGLDGFEVCRRIKADASSTHLPVIMLSAQSDSKSRIDGFAAGATDFIGKPFVIGEMLARIRVHIELQETQHHLRINLSDQQRITRKLEDATHQLLQAEKMASIGQLAAGVAHELNNPIGFVSSNCGTLENYLRDVFAIADAYAKADNDSAQMEPVRQLKRDKDYDYLRSDIFYLMAESKDGLQRVAKIIKDLKDFSRAGDSQMHWADLHQGLDSTLNIVWNELKYKCTVTKHYGDLPQVWCESSQLNQVFMNLLLNAGQAIAERGTITLRTGQQGDEVFVAIADTGSGIAADNLKRIFEPFFTTKPVGTGTGLGLSLSYGIIQKHHGRIEVHSEVGQGSTFTVWLPIEVKKEKFPRLLADAVPPAPTFHN